MAARTLFRNVRVITTTGIASGEALMEEGRIAGVERPGVLPADVSDIIDGGGEMSHPYIFLDDRGILVYNAL